MENNDYQPPVNPPAFPTPHELRAQARESLKGNWKIALGIMAVVTLIVTLITELLGWMGNVALIPLNGNVVDLAHLTSAVIYLFVFAAVTILISPLTTVVFARISRSAVTGEKIDFSLLRLSGRELLRGARVTLVTVWRAVLIPLLILYGVLVAEIILLYAGMNIPEALGMILTYGIAIAVVVWIVCRLMYYQPVYQLMVISPDAKARELADQSKELMKGNRLRLVGLNLSFFGWMLLYGAFQGIGEEMLSDPSLWTALQVFGFVCLFVRLPLDLYMDTALAAFTKDLLER